MQGSREQPAKTINDVPKIAYFVLFEQINDDEMMMKIIFSKHFSENFHEIFMLATFHEMFTHR